MNVPACLLWSWLAAAPEPAESNPSTAEAAFAEGFDHYREGRYAEASADFARAYRREPDPRYLYSWAQSERKTGNCAVAVQLYRRYLEHDLPAENIDAARTNMLRCGYTWTEEDEKSDDVDLDAVDLGEIERASSTTAPSRDWWLDPTGASLFAVGTASTATTIGLWAAWSFERNAALRARTEELHARHVRRADQLQVAGIVTSVVGAGLLVGGIIRYAIVRRRDKHTTRVAIGGWGSPTFTLRF